jgi:hypothetical protein
MDNPMSSAPPGSDAKIVSNIKARAHLVMCWMIFIVIVLMVVYLVTFFVNMLITFVVMVVHSIFQYISSIIAPPPIPQPDFTTSVINIIMRRTLKYYHGMDSAKVVPVDTCRVFCW